MADEASQSLSLKVLVDEEKNRVVFIESENDFIDVLFSFMTMPIGNIIRLTHDQALKWEIGCLNSLYESIENLDDKHLQSVKCKDILLHPRSAAEIYCRNLKLNFVTSTTNDYYACGSGQSCPLCPYRTARCPCGNPLNYIVKLKNPISVRLVGGVFVKPTSRFMITDDFQVLPMSTMTCLTLLKDFGAVGRTVKQWCINVGKDEVLKMLKCSLTSMEPFSETILESPAKRARFAIHRGEFIPRSTDESQRAMGTSSTTSKEANIALKLIIDKCNNRALYVEAREDFVDLISSFLTIPLGYVFKEFPCLSLKGCLANIYKSIQALDVDEFLISEEMKATLVNPKRASGIACNKQLIPIQDALYPSWSTADSLFGINFVPSTENITAERLMKGPSKYMVTDNLTVTPLSPMSGLSLINNLNVDVSDIVEREVTIGEEEALCLLEAAWVSKSALTDVLILKEPKQEPQESLSPTVSKG